MCAAAAATDNRHGGCVDDPVESLPQSAARPRCRPRERRGHVRRRVSGISANTWCLVSAPGRRLWAFGGAGSVATGCWGLGEPRRRFPWTSTDHIWGPVLDHAADGDRRNDGVTYGNWITIV